MGGIGGPTRRWKGIRRGKDRMCKRTPAMAVCNKKVNKSYPQAKHGYPQTAVDKMGYQQGAVDSVDNYMST
jgi:hypothetical protein